MAAAVLAAALTFAVVKLLDHLNFRDADRQARALIAQAEREVENLRKEAELERKELALQQRDAGEKELSKLREDLHDRERQLDKRQDSVDQQADQLRKQERMVEGTQRKLADRIDELSERKKELDEVYEAQRQQLHQLSGLDREQAKELLLERLDRELKHETGARIIENEKRIAETCDTKAREMLITSMQRFAAAHTAETTTSTVDIPNDDMKGRIIGREGRNIRAFEKATGVDVIIDDTPGVVIVSAFDTVRREIARQALDKLIADGRIHPSRIEEVVGETQQEIENDIRKHGEAAAQEADVPGLHPKVIQLLGRLRYRTSYSQNVLRHSIEVAFLASMMAEEVHLDADLARRCGLLHDIGKAADHDADGGHPKIGADLLKRYNEGPEVVHAALGHHDDLRIANPYTVLVAAADAASASRPGARRETLERYIKRMEELESIATGFDGVDQAYAIQAGREVRVLVRAEDTSDESAAKICRDIAKAYEDQLTYPGEIKVTVIRESRMSSIAH
ncbi:MAG: ribonuclease Y [Planctomycetales bacterium]|nr:ribonuclease Y [Planctomycetales bacterium]